MEQLLSKVLKKYLNLFIKDFSADNFNVSLLKGKVTFSNTDLNTKVVQEILMMPPNLVVDKAVCNFMEIDVPWTKLNSKPISVAVDKIDLVLIEPETIEAMPEELSTFRKKRKKKSKSGGSSSNSNKDLLLGLYVEIKEVHVTVKTRSLPSQSNWNPEVHITIQNVTIQSTNSKWESQDLLHCKDVDPNDPEVSVLYKTIEAKTISISMLDASKQTIHIIKDEPLFTSKWKLKDGLWLGGKLDIIYVNLLAQMTTEEWNSFGNFINALRHCFRRPVPAPAKPETPPATSNDPPLVDVPLDNPDSPRKSQKNLSLTVRLERWGLQLATQDETKGFKFEGTGLLVNLSSEAQNSDAVITLSSIGLCTLAGKYSTVPLVSHQAHQFDLVCITLASRAKSNNQTKADPLMELVVNVKLHSLEFVLDIAMWHSLKLLLLQPFNSFSVPSIPEDTSKLKEKLQHQLYKQMNRIEDWNDIKLFVEASNAKLIIYDPEQPAAVIQLASVRLKTNPNWEEISMIQNEPALRMGYNNHEPAKETKHNSEDGEAKHSVVENTSIKKAITKRIATDTFYRFESDWTGVSISLVDIAKINASDPSSCVLLANTMKVFFRFIQTRESIEEHFKSQFRAEIGISSGMLRLSASECIRHIVQSLRRGLKSVPSKMPKLPQVTHKIKEKILHTKQEEFQPLQLLDTLKSNMKQTLHKFKIAFLLKADKGEFIAPVSLLGPHSNLSDQATFKVAFETLEIGALNGGGKQTALFNLRTIELNNLDHPKSDNIITLLPATSADSQAIKIFSLKTHEMYNLRLLYTRNKKNSKSLSEVTVQLHELRIILTPKSKDSTNSSTQLPDFQRIVHRIMALVDQKREKLFNGLNQYKEKEGELNQLKNKLNFDLHWKFEFSNLFIGFKDSDASKDTYKGMVTISNTFQTSRMCDKFLELEKQLIDSKINLATQGSQVDHVQFREEQLKKQKRELEDKVSKLESDLHKQANLYKDMENNYITAKLKQSQLEMEFQNLQQELQQLKRKK